MTTPRRLLVACLLLLSSAGCATDVPSSGTSTPSTLFRFGAPEASQPRSANTVYPSPCTSLLSPTELSGLGIVTPGRERTYSVVQECAWTTRNDDRLRIGVDITRDLLVDSYRAPRPAIFEPSDVDGVPTVRQRLSPDSNSCNVTVGLSASQSLEVDWTGSAPASSTTDLCARAEEAIALVVRKLPPQR